MPACGTPPASQRACSESSSPDCSETISISALSGWPMAELTVSLPSPAE
jgi:hypothetical protein